MLRSHIVVVEAVSLLPGERQNLLRTWCEVIHHLSGVARRVRTCALSMIRYPAQERSFNLAPNQRRPQGVPFFCGQFLSHGAPFCRWAGWVSMKSMSTGQRCASGKKPEIHPQA